MKDKYPARFYRNRSYIGVKTRSRVAPYLDWKDTLSIRRFNGKPYNKYEYDRIMEYNQDAWNSLLDEIRDEAERNNKDVEITESYAYTVPKWVHIPKVN